ncbi:MAG: acetyl-CoA carboxylase biotin carboxyl carrier protein [Nitrospiraceae bacterium]|nr:MAG: acetyl-CoA carboxylase biotin carboxyl carrier protein [Nitrospiraceae bacterium]
MEFDEIRKLIEFLQQTDITELRIEREDSKVRIRREKLPGPQSEALQHTRPAAPEKTEAVREISEDRKLITITSPIVGIFHRAPSPESPPFVEVGSSVRKGQVLCIVEAMKLMNEIESDANGTIARILIENGHAVEYGEALFLVEPAS